MSEAKHTPGPLVIRGQQQSTEIGSFYVIGPVGRSCTAYVATPDDARLYAAAPKMLETLHKIENALDWATTPYSLEWSLRQCARAAIAEATGVQS